MAQIKRFVSFFRRQKFLLRKLLIFRQIHKIIFLQDCMFEEMYLNLHSLIK